MKLQKGVLSSEYHSERKKKLALKYRLARRTEEVLRIIRSCKRGTGSMSLLDIGTADGLMLDRLYRELDIQTGIGLDFSSELMKKNTNYIADFIQADAMELPFKDNIFDIVVAAAVIEHVPDAGKMLAECNRVMAKDGLCIITTPDPFFEHIATRIGHLDDEQHNETFDLARLKHLFELHSFTVVEAGKFMMSPVGFPFEITIEKVMKFIGLRFLLLNQIVAGRKN